MPTKFMGVFDMTTGAGSLGGSFTVAVIFCIAVELLKFFDPNTSGTSLFAQFF